MKSEHVSPVASGVDNSQHVNVRIIIPSYHAQTQYSVCTLTCNNPCYLFFLSHTCILSYSSSLTHIHSFTCTLSLSLFFLSLHTLSPSISHYFFTLTLSQSQSLSLPFSLTFSLSLSLSLSLSPNNTALDCGPLADPTNGEVITESTLLGSQASYSCLGSGFILRGDSSRQCSTTGLWTGSQPVCESMSIYTLPNVSMLWLLTILFLCIALHVFFME